MDIKKPSFVKTWDATRALKLGVLLRSQKKIKRKPLGPVPHKMEHSTGRIYVCNFIDCPFIFFLHTPAVHICRVC
jgi:hypothetical protein